MFGQSVGDILFRPLNQRAKWSNLLNIGGSSVARLTILAPFLGYLIVFNETFIEFFSFRFPSEADEGGADSFLDYLNERRTFFLYFGLVIFGVGSTLVAVFAPRQISHFKAVEQYVLAMQEIETRALVADRLLDTVSYYYRSSQGETRSGFFAGSALSFPEEPSDGLHNLAEEIFVAGNEVDRLEQGASEFYTGSGYVVTEAVLDILEGGSRHVDRMWREGMLSYAFEHKSKDVFYLDYSASEYKNVIIRFLIFFLFLIGAFLLLIPSLTTLILVALVF